MKNQNVGSAARKETLNSRIPGLDALRGLAAIGVVIHHYQLYFNAGPDLLILYPAYKGATFFVDLFFVLSGFLLVQVYSNSSSFLELVIKRFSRLFPLQWLTLVLVLVGQYFYTLAWGEPFIYKINDTYHFILNVLLLQSSGLQTGFSYNGPSWSISVEWLINLLFFALLLHRKFLVLGAILIAISGILLLSLCKSRINEWGMCFGVIDATLLRVAFGFFVGVIAAVLSMRFPATVASRNALCWDVIATTFGAIFIAFLCASSLNGIMFLQIIVVGFILPILVIACSRGKLAGGCLSIRPLLWLGDISYAVSLTHFCVLLLVFGIRKHLPVPLNSGEGMLATLAIVVLVSHVVFVYFERPAQSYLRVLLSMRGWNYVQGNTATRIKK
jgi:peptidoglycan/LPS O-acetylase OafA/YrhL